MKNQKKNDRAAAALMAVVLCIAGTLCACTGASKPTKQPAHATAPHATRPDDVTTEPTETIPVETVTDDIELDFGLTITDSGKYTGLYMEDGSNEVLSDVMMVIVQNNGDRDIQLAEFTAEADGETYRFQLTNLAVGARAVLLDLDRKPSGGAVTSAAMENTALFELPMALCADVIKVSGMDGMVNVQNISGEDITGDIFVYYKYAAQDIFYGGITFRVRVEGGLRAGEIRQIPAGHYTAEGCTIVQVTVYD